MNKERKTSYAAYAAWNYEKEEDRINEESKKGWQLVKGGCFHSVYEKNNSKRYIYKIDYNTITMRDGEEKDRYIQMFEELGWDYINSTFNGWNYFKKAYDENLDESEYEIYTDNTSYNEMLARWCKIGKVALVVEVIGAIYYILSAIYLKNLTIGIMSIVFILLAIWIKGGLTSMKNKLKMD